MQKFRVLLNGENLLFLHEGELRKFGFYTSRTLDADSEEVAETMAIASVLTDSSLAHSPPKNDSTNPPRIWAESITQVEATDASDERTGLVFYLMDQN
jgi:hypothetical protein